MHRAMAMNAATASPPVSGAGIRREFSQQEHAHILPRDLPHADRQVHERGTLMWSSFVPRYVKFVSE